MKEILKRLEIIKSCIAIEDEESLYPQVHRLYSLKIDEKVEKILKLIEETNFQEVISLIDQYLGQFSSLVVHEDKEIQGLKLELKVLEKELLTLSCKIEEYHNKINDFNSRYHKEVGVLIEEILILREEYFEFLYKKDGKKYEYQYFEAKKDFENFHEEIKKFKLDDPYELTKLEKTELKRLYRKASRLCHPDIIEEAKKEKAEEIFKELNSAYQQNNLKKVSRILNNLLNGESFSCESDTLFDKNILKNKIELAREKIKLAKTEIEIIKKDETFRLINKIENLDEYIYEMKEELKEEKENLVAKMRQYSTTI
ncbi:heat shock protein DnaJ domain protein [Arcobacter nitrofigilis DSM 7299]|uniref:Heat shock protein DnaJ domain protein n=1 Tax=Arcobacter nitrofigilis (strain ATCC 33309 / DSM 7299 / CCUG 15893 / LMG 7604 / NCTC 12251 / CI) TaxID=572480 RepID=D5UZ58_ARCNC|nr:J domain-containing protein [Arcobacter nitrofigilis]ADG94110.1 heat shock protein DnaJ domain protein [Arcobacter nitrofigilis DSM 7299]